MKHDRYSMYSCQMLSFGHVLFWSSYFFFFSCVMQHELHLSAQFWQNSHIFSEGEWIWNIRQSQAHPARINGFYSLIYQLLFKPSKPFTAHSGVLQKLPPPHTHTKSSLHPHSLKIKIHNNSLMENSNISLITGWHFIDRCQTNVFY